MRRSSEIEMSQGFRILTQDRYLTLYTSVETLVQEFHKRGLIISVIKSLVLINKLIKLILSTRSKCVCVVCACVLARSYIQVSLFKYMPCIYFSPGGYFGKTVKKTAFHISVCFNHLIMQQKSCLSPQYAIDRLVHLLKHKVNSDILGQALNLNKTYSPNK